MSDDELCIYAHTINSPNVTAAWNIRETSAHIERG